MQPKNVFVFGRGCRSENKKENLSTASAGTARLGVAEGEAGFCAVTLSAFGETSPASGSDAPAVYSVLACFNLR
jgi:hypothetical protein